MILMEHLSKLMRGLLDVRSTENNWEMYMCSEGLYLFVVKVWGKGVGSGQLWVRVGWRLERGYGEVNTKI